MKNAKKLAVLAMFLAIALVLSWLENLLPPPLPSIPGIKLGLANLPVLLILFGETRFPRPAASAFAVSAARVLLAGFMFTGLWGALYSLAGALFSFAVMFLCKLTKKFSLIGVSIAGGVAHNLAQLAIAVFAMSEPRLVHLYPALIISGIFAGFLVGFAAKLVDQILYC